MEFKSLKKIETSFRQIRTMGIVFVSLCALVTGYALWSSYRFAERQREKIYVLDNGKSLILALSQDLSQNRPVEAKEHIRRFHELFFTLSPDKAAIESNIRRALFLCDESMSTIPEKQNIRIKKLKNKPTHLWYFFQKFFIRDFCLV